MTDAHRERIQRIYIPDKPYQEYNDQDQPRQWTKNWPIAFYIWPGGPSHAQRAPSPHDTPSHITGSPSYTIHPLDR